MNFKAPTGRVLVKIDTKQKERYAFESGTTIHISRGFNFNRREDYPTRAEIINGKDLPKGADILVHHNSVEPCYEVFENEDFLTEAEISAGYKILSLPVDMCFAYRVGSEWLPCPEYLITKRIFKPYNGFIVGIEPETIANRLYIEKGSTEWDGEKTVLDGRVAIVTVNSDYEIIYHDAENKEHHLIRTRHREILGLDGSIENDVKIGKLTIGINAKEAKPYAAIVS